VLGCLKCDPVKVVAEEGAQLFGRPSAERGRCAPPGEVAVRLRENILSEVFIGEGGGRQGGGRIDIHLIGLELRELIRVHRVLQLVWGVRGDVDVGHLASRGTGLQIVRHRAGV
jgi:hypothetical protein